MAKIVSVVVVLIIICLLIFSGPSPQRVTRVIDGDTLEVGAVRVRLYGIDAPESGQPYGALATAALAEIVTDRDVVVEEEDKDRYGRTVATVVVSGYDVAPMLLRTGAAWFDGRFMDTWDSRYRSYQLAEEEARSKGLGLWSASRPVPPWEWRRR